MGFRDAGRSASTSDVTKHPLEGGENILDMRKETYKDVGDKGDKSKTRDLSFAEKDSPRFAEIAAKADARYAKAENFSRDTRCFENYAEHKQSHIEKVYKGTEKTARELSKMDKVPEGYTRPTESDMRNLKAAALWHDTGMDGNRENLAAIHGDEAVAILDRGDLSEKESLVRKNHGESAALNVLSERDAFERAGLDADQVAVDCALHSKSGSGMKDLSSDEQWGSFINKLNNSAQARGVEFDKTKFMDADGNMLPEAKERCATHAFCLRVGDANGHDMTDNELQDGSHRLIDREGFSPSEISAEGAWIREAEKNNVQIEATDGSRREIDDARSKAYALGEGNIRSMDMRHENGTMVEHIEVDDGSFAPESTIMCIGERAGELASAKGMDTRISIDVDVSNMSPDEISKAKETYATGAERIEAKTSNPDKYAQPIKVDVFFYDNDGIEV